MLDRMAAFADDVRSGGWTGHTGRPIRNVVNIGIGGSDLGPVMAYEALRHYSRREMTFRFVSNVDGTDFAEATRDLDPAETLFIISSKTFTTLETMTNAHTARAWMPARARRRAGGAPALRRRLDQRGGRGEVRHRPRQHVRLLGLGRRALFHGLGDRPLDDAGDRARSSFRDDARRVPRRWTSTSAPRRSTRNLPVLMGLLAVWYTDFFDAQTVAVLPYDQYLEALPGLPPAADHGEQRQARHARRRARRLPDRPDLWGEPGTNGQHSFYQLIHQGTRLIPCDFIAFCQPLNPLGGHHDLLMANVFAQTEALAFGKTAERGRGRGHAGLAGAAPRLRGQPADHHDARRSADARRRWARSSRSTSTASSRRA